MEGGIEEFWVGAYIWSDNVDVLVYSAIFHPGWPTDWLTDRLTRSPENESDCFHGPSPNDAFQDSLGSFMKHFVKSTVYASASFSFLTVNSEYQKTSS